MKNDLMSAAVSSDNLQVRAQGNKKFSSNDFDEWTDKLINELSFDTVLDLCCGTGNQLVKYSNINNVKKLVGVDLSEESLLLAEKRVKNINENIDLSLKKLPLDAMFEDEELKDSQFDLISCFYGLYYSENTENVLNNAVKHLSDNGILLIVGPYGNNNKDLFDILQRHIELPELVLRSSGTFMQDEVLKALSEEKLEIQINKFENKIVYPDLDSVLNYWKATTFYSKEKEPNIINELQEHFKSDEKFIVEKHVMAVIGRKKK